MCAEIIEYSDKSESAVCNLASIALPKMLKQRTYTTTPKVRLYSKTNCNFCKMAKALLKEFHLEYNEILLDNVDERERFYTRCSLETNLDIQSVPQIYMDGVYICLLYTSPSPRDS